MYIYTEHLKYLCWNRWRYGSLLNGPLGGSDKVHFTLTHRGVAGESLWASKVGRDLYQLKNNGFHARVAYGDVVRVAVRYPYLEVVEVVERARRTVRIAFDLPWPTGEERAFMSQEIVRRGGEIEWGYPYLLAVSISPADDPYELLEGLLGQNARIFEVDRSRGRHF